jgi:hypothetical protein
MDFKYTGFISYRRTPRSQKCARFFYKLLHEYEQDFGSTVFFDEVNIGVGQIIPEEIFEGIRQSLSLLFFFVPVSIKESNPWCAYELKHFLDYEDKRIKKLKNDNPLLNEKNCRQVIPIIIRGKKEDLPIVLQDRLFINFNEELMLTLRRDQRFMKEAYNNIIQVFENLKDIFKDFENDAEILSPPLDYESCVEILNYQRPFPSIKISKANGK